MARSSTRVLLVDDHAIVREIVKRKLAEIPGVAVREAENGGDALELAFNEDFNLIVLDITLPDRNGLEVLGVLRSKKPSLPVLMFSLYPEVPYALQTFKTGAAGYLYKENALEHVIDAVRRVADGGVYVSPRLSQYVAGLMASDPLRTLHEIFSDEEFQVFCGIAQKLSMRQIAEKMHMREEQISKIRSRILDLTSIPDEAGLADYAARNGLISSNRSSRM